MIRFYKYVVNNATRWKVLVESAQTGIAGIVTAVKQPGCDFVAQGT